MLFAYRGVDREGKSAKGTVTANALDEAKQKLRSQGIYYHSLEEQEQRLSLNLFITRAMPSSLLSSISKELSSYLNSGMTILTALKLMENQHKHSKKLFTFLNAVRTMIEEGKSLSVALSSQSVYTLPDYYLHSLKVAGHSGKMVEVLTNMGNFFSAQSRLKKQVGNAMAYPLFIFVVAMAITGFLITSVVPKITGIFADTGKELPPLTEFVLGVSDFLTANYIGLLAVLIILLGLFRLAVAKWHRFRLFVDHMLLGLPIVGTLIQNHELGRFSYILALMLDSGVSYAQAVHLATATFSNVAFRESFEQAAIKVTEGNSLSSALQMASGAKPKRNFLQALALGEESSEVASILQNLSAYYGEENDDRIKLLLSLTEPVMMLLVGLIVGLIVAAMLLPIFSMSLGNRV